MFHFDSKNSLYSFIFPLKTPITYIEQIPKKFIKDYSSSLMMSLFLSNILTNIFKLLIVRTLVFVFIEQ